MKSGRSLPRRDFLRLTAAGAGAAVLSACQPAAAPTAAPVPPPTAVPPTAPATPEPAPTSPPAAPQPVLRIAHISDMHIEPSGPGREKFARALHQIATLSPAVDFVINAGDCVMDVLYADRARADEQWDTFQSVLTPDFPLPVYYAIGNHDVWGWGLQPEDQAAAQADPLYAKNLMLTRLGMKERYYAFDQAGWRFIVLDSIHPREIESEFPYTGKLDDEQYAWLDGQLSSAGPAKPICIVSHIPIFGACGLLDGNNEASGNWQMPGAWMHIDARRLWKLFWKHPNVRLCLSGHTHQVEDLRYHGVQYLTNGAISGDWWNGVYMDFPPGYVLLNLYADGSAENQFVAY